MAEELCICQRTPQSCSELGTQLSWSEWSPSSLNIAAVWYIVPDQTTEKESRQGGDSALKKGTCAVSLRTCLLTSSLRGPEKWPTVLFKNCIFLQCTKLIHYKYKQRVFNFVYISSRNSLLTSVWLPSFILELRFQMNSELIIKFCRCEWLH